MLLVKPGQVDRLASAKVRLPNIGQIAWDLADKTVGSRTRVALTFRPQISPKKAENMDSAVARTVPTDLLRRHQTLLDVGEVIHAFRDVNELFRHLADCL